ncbi:hypothetical protein FB45DRAFT_914031 [Roridomyces roridus]|uniref:Uncharacterized protein n=1 Tax=Roridomyces roridus TaxID=1738132 RepID=A0AAD7BYK5_9AGAR|nr:hypothetical protein FB45DRAFT_914031 [Roridomyces roridus]
MSVYTSQRHSRPSSPPTTTPLRSRSSVAALSNTTYSPTVTNGANSSKLNVVTRVAIEGKAKQGEDGAGIKMYLKISLPLDAISPGSTIPLFPEEHVKILHSQIHPLDNNSVPYDFSSDLCPLLHHAARALNLSSRSSESYNAAFGLSPPTTTASIAGSIKSTKSSGSTKSATPPVDTKYTGHILVSGYNISYVLPKEFPGRVLDSDVYSRSSSSMRRSSVVDRNSVHFMAALDLWVPYASRPPRLPYLLSIPTPRCLHNNVRLRIFAPTSTSASQASLSSADEEGGSWDLTSDPHVTRATSSRQSRSGNYSYGDVADDESSDSSTTGFSDGYGIQGTFPSAERIRVRWAKPIKSVTGEARRRVGVNNVKGEMTCAVLGKMWDPVNQRDGVVMKVTYQGTCKGTWFPGVATMLGMDVSLEAKGSDVSWVPGGNSETWQVGGSQGYTGFDVGASPKPDAPSRHDSLESNYSNGFLTAERAGISRQSSASSSTTSLLRGPLPVPNVADYSFEGPNPSSMSASQTTSMESSVGSLVSSAPSVDAKRPPGVPVTIHINMNELPKVFQFSITGTVLVTPRLRVAPSRSSSPAPAGNEQDIDPESVVIPRFTVLAADAETVSIVLRNETDACTVEFLDSNSSHERATRKVLQRREFSRCSERARFVVKSGVIFAPTGNGDAVAAPNGKLAPPSRPRTPSTSRDRVPSTSGNRGRPLIGMVSRPKRDGALMIPSVVADVTPIVETPEDASRCVPKAYAVRVTLAAPVDAESDWLEFGLAKHASAAVVAGTGPPKVEIVGVSVDDVPVLYETSVAVKQEETAVGLPFEQMSGQEWVSWVKLRVGAAGGGRVVVDYVVTDVDAQKTKVKDRTQFDVFLPTFGLPVGRLQVNIEGNSDLEISSLRTNFSHNQVDGSGRRLLHYSLSPFFYPHITMDLKLPRRPLHSATLLSSNLGQLVAILILWIALAIASVYLVRLNSEVFKLSRALEAYAIAPGPGWNERPPETFTITSTAFQTTRWPWFDAPSESASESISTVTISVTAPPVTITAPAIPTETHRVHPTSDSSSSSLAVFQPLLLNFSNLKWPEVDVDLVLEKIVQGAEKLWFLLRRIYHYPLDPT